MHNNIKLYVRERRVHSPEDSLICFVKNVHCIHCILLTFLRLSCTTRCFGALRRLVVTTLALCSTWECVGDQNGGTDMRSIKYCPPAIQDGEDYTVNRLDQAASEVKKMFGEDRRKSDRPGFYIKTYIVCLINS